MESRIKKIIAREILIVVVPIALLILILVGLGVYFQLSLNDIDRIEKNILDEIQIERKFKIDSVNKADSLETIEILKRTNNPETPPKFDPNKPYTILSSDDLIRNVHGDIVSLDSRAKDFENLKMKRYKLDKSAEALFGTKSYNGLIGIIYIVFLVIIYPFRFIVYILIWSIKTVRTK